MQNDTVSQESAAGAETGPESDETIYSTPHRELIRQAGRLARAEQERLERESRLLRGQTPG
jgi:hypothetical protein